MAKVLQYTNLQELWFYLIYFPLTSRLIGDLISLCFHDLPHKLLFVLLYYLGWFGNKVLNICYFIVSYIWS
jgi:hypothetical protein